MPCDRCGEDARELQPVRVGDLLVLEACHSCADQLAGELLSRLTPTGLERRWDAVSAVVHRRKRVDHVRGLLDAERATRIDSAVEFLTRPRR
jgi:hypothetical protein